MSLERHSRINDALWAVDVDEALRELAVAAQDGLDDSEVNRRRLTFGRNQLQEVKPRHIFSILAGQFKSIVTVYSFCFRVRICSVSLHRITGCKCQ